MPSDWPSIPPCFTAEAAGQHKWTRKLLLRAGSVASAPRVWVLLDDRPGNSTQSLGLAEALGWPFETVELLFGWRSRLHNRWLGASVRGLRSGSRAKLVAPWPDLLIAAGRRTAPVGLWIKRASGGKPLRRCRA